MQRLIAVLGTFATSLLCAAFVPSGASAQTVLTSDQAVYTPGSNAELTGSGFAPDESVTLQVVHADGSPSTGPEHAPWSVAADAGGGFVTTWLTCMDDCVGQLLQATANGVSSGSPAGTTFANHVCGNGVVTSVTPVGGSCAAFTPAVGAGPDNYEVQQGGTYTMTIAGVTECSGSTITVFVQSSSTGNFCFNATGGSGTYVGTFTMPNPACNTMPVSYKCGAGATCNHPGSFGAQGPTSGCGGVHLRASNFNGSCVKTSTDTDCSGGGCTPCTLVCPPDVTVDCTAPTAPSNTGTPTGCAGASFTDSETPGSCAGNYVITRTWSAPNGCGDTVTCEQEITVTDTTPPVISCPGNASVDCSASTDPASTGSASATDDCSGVASISHSDSTAAGNCAGNYVITRTWTATDGCGNSSSCTQTITVTDTTPPVISCPGNASVDCSASTDPASTGSASATDDCSGVASISHSDSTAAGNCAGNHVITRTWTATDGCGNSSSCTQTITVTDTTPPVISCPSGAVVDCSASTDPVDTGSASATDDCSGVASISHSDSVSQPDPACAFRTITRTWTATDGCGNSSSCVQMITVTDTTAPTISCPADVSLSGCCVSIGIGTATATDDCSDVTVTNDAPPSFCVGDTLVTWTATDGCGNYSTCQQTVTVVEVVLDFEGPLLHGQNLVTPGPEVPFSCPSISGGPDPVTPGNGNNGPAIFNSTSGPFGADPDLDVDLGNILYLQRNGSPTDAFTGINGPDTWDHPNDDEDGGTLTFDFCGGVEALSIDLIDIDPPAPTNNVSVVLTDINNLTRTYTVPAGWTDAGPGAAAVGNLLLNAVGVQLGFSANATESTMAGYDELNVVKIVVRLGSSGALDNLKYCPSLPRASATARNGADVNPMILAATTLPVLGGTWRANLDCSDFDVGVATVVVRRSPSSGTMTPMGEVLVGGDLVRTTTQAFSRSVSSVAWDIPFDLSLVGTEVSAQGLCRATASGPKLLQARRLSNAVDLILGF
ncbi:MAG: hypothetical protein HOP15_16325 [Planctomycetes bacterium]|nr:hypothetical protein [Planctomycetota bacterium]